MNPNNVQSPIFARDAVQAARDKGLETRIAHAGDRSEFDVTFALLGQSDAGTVLIIADAPFISNRPPLVDLPRDMRCPRSMKRDSSRWRAV